MAILKYANQSGTVYAYSSVSEWDPVKKCSRSKRKCLGRVDPETGDIIPTSGKRGRPPKHSNGDAPAEVQDNTKAVSDEEILKLKKECEALRSRNKELEMENQKLRKAILFLLQETKLIQRFRELLVIVPKIAAFSKTMLS